MDNKKILYKIILGGFFLVIPSIYLLTTILAFPPFLRIILVLPALYINPGFFFISVIKKQIQNIIKIIIESFLISLILLNIIYILFKIIDFKTNLLFWGAFSLFFGVLNFLLISLNKTDVKNTDGWNFLLIGILFLLIFSFILIFYNSSTLLTPDENTYTHYAVKLYYANELDGLGSPIGSFLEGRYLWIIILSQFYSTTFIDITKIGLINFYFLFFIGLSSSLFIKEKRLKFFSSILICLNPILMFFSSTSLNDITVAFFITCSIYYFIGSFNSTENGYYIDFFSFFKALVFTFFLALIKLNFLFLLPLSLFFFHIFLKTKHLRKKKSSVKVFRTLFKLSLIIILLYYFLIEIPYVISAWFLKDGLSKILNKFIIYSPTERILYFFITPSWRNERTVFDLSKIYAILQPEVISLLIISSLLYYCIGYFLKFINIKLDSQKKNSKAVQFNNNLINFTLISILFVIIFSQENSNTDIVRYNLWLIPLIIVSALKILHKDIFHKINMKKIGLFIFCMSIIVGFNLYIFNEKGSIFYLMYQKSSIESQYLMTQLLIFITTLLILSSFLIKSKILNQGKFIVVEFKKVFYKLNKKSLSYLLIFLILMGNSIYFSLSFVFTSTRFDDNDFNNKSLKKIGSKINQYSQNSIIMTNDLMSLRNFINPEIYDEGYIITGPPTKEEFYKFIQNIPDLYVFISKNYIFSDFEFMNLYIKSEFNKKFYGWKLFNFTEDSVKSYNHTERLDCQFDLDFVDYANIGSGCEVSIESSWEGHDKVLKMDSITGNYILIRNDFPFDGEYSGERELWIYAKDGGLGSAQTIHFISESNEDMGMMFFDGSGKIQWYYDNTNKTIDSDNNFDQWNHILFEWNGNDMNITINDGSITSVKFDESKTKPGHILFKVGNYQTMWIDSFGNPTKRVIYADSIEILYNSGTPICNIIKTNRENETIDNNEIIVNEIRYWKEDSGYKVNLEIEVESLNSTNISMIIGTWRYSKILNYDIAAGIRNIKINFDYELNQTLWKYSDKIKLIIISNGQIIYHNNLRFTNGDFIQVILFLLLTSLIGLTLISVKYEQSLTKKNKNY